ncbi:unnamed protein product [Nezara viridula]|uniref:Uncharacterized protein n=1 Tax=Nezara viridula TaxID=85310 RepID=A0A9P0MXG8_NEZVI|nr:unnamed protein product [Nezara viridula]
MLKATISRIYLATPPPLGSLPRSPRTGLHIGAAFKMDHPGAPTRLLYQAYKINWILTGLSGRASSSITEISCLLSSNTSTLL